MRIASWRCGLRNSSKARVSLDSERYQKRAEMEYFQSLQHLYTAVQDAVAEQNL